ncbi:MAG: hypothetical protein CO119_02685 [Flavobacteriales bacterium CG_4_9_14_3_um_filter_40_17]|nr:MAG: hypothetical protein CO119_02685 [Flavobacteriales bacterium CG_4_9_14_3_um_filter_40_17]
MYKHILILLAIAACYNMQAQVFKENHRVKIGVMYGWADQSPYKEADYSWESNQIKLQFSYLLKKGRVFDYEFLSEPQVNITKFRLFNRTLNLTEEERKANKVVDQEHLLEYGITNGILFRHHLTKYLSTYGIISFGALYLGDSTARLPKGINFASQASLGISLQTFKKTSFDIRAGIRHLSNAGLKSPNSGVNTFHVETGFMISL